MTEATPHISGHTGAAFSADENHRFALWRWWDFRKPLVLFIGLNPSRGHAFYNDHTIRRCISFTKAWGYGGMMFGNLFTLKSPRPAMVKADPEAACHPKNDEWLLYMMRMAGPVVVCWGSWDFIEKRTHEVIDLLGPRDAGLTKRPFCFGLTKDGSPKHPARLSNKSQLIEFPTKPILV